MGDFPEFIPGAGACLASRNVTTGEGSVRWMVRDQPVSRADNGWRIFSHIDTQAYLADPSNLQVTDYNEICAIEPALIGIYDFPVGSDLQIVDEGDGVRIVDTSTGRPIPAENFYVPPAHRKAD